VQSLLRSAPAPLGHRLEVWQELEDRCEEIWSEVCAAWPSIKVAPDDYFAYLGFRLDAEAEPSAAFDGLDSTSLYLACGCAAGDSFAIAEFKAILLPYARATARRMGLSEGDAEDLCATLCEQLLVPRAGELPRITQYSGRGNIRAWLKVSTTRLAMRSARKESRKRDLDDDDLVLEGSVESEDLVLAYLRQQYREPFKRAFREAFRSLPMEDRLLLRRKFVDELTGDELAQLYSVHRATIVRRIGRTRQKLVDEIRSQLLLLGISTDA
jgi:RNA polymerase sigma-70 factor (ECF subfamily)